MNKKLDVVPLLNCHRSAKSQLNMCVFSFHWHFVRIKRAKLLPLDTFPCSTRCMQVPCYDTFVWRSVLGHGHCQANIYALQDFRNRSRQRDDYYKRLLASCMSSIDWHHCWWAWVTFKRYSGVYIARLYASVLICKRRTFCDIFLSYSWAWPVLHYVINRRLWQWRSNVANKVRYSVLSTTFNGRNGLTTHVCCVAKKSRNTAKSRV